MFGYIRPQKSELLVREYEQYKGIYCSLCKRLGSEYGVLTRLTLSYDCTFVAMVRQGLAGNCKGFHQGKCVVNPLKKCTYCSEQNEDFRFAAALSIILTWHKLYDDKLDGRFFSKLRSGFLMLLAKRSYKKAAADYPELAQKAESLMLKQREEESKAKPSVDACADSTAQLLSYVFACSQPVGSTQRRILEQFGYFLGRWIYLMDASDDLTKDLKTGEFNPFRDYFGFEGKTELSPQEKEHAEKNCNHVLNMTASSLTAALNLLEFQQFGSIINNVITLGIPEMQREILFLHTKEKKNVRSI